MALNILTSRRGMDPLFDQFFPGDAKQVEVAPTRPLTVMPLPEQGKPAIHRAVGTFDFTLSAKPTTLAVGDPVTLRMQITGAGNPANVERADGAGR